jgi:hypothetical protein
MQIDCRQCAKTISANRCDCPDCGYDARHSMLLEAEMLLERVSYSNRAITEHTATALARLAKTLTMVTDKQIAMLHPRRVVDGPISVEEFFNHWKR